MVALDNKQQVLGGRDAVAEAVVAIISSTVWILLVLGLILVFFIGAGIFTAGPEEPEEIESEDEGYELEEPVMPKYRAYFVPTDLTRTLVQMIKAIRGCRYVNSEILEENFPIQRTGVSGKIKIILVHLGKAASTNEALQHMDDFGLRPVRIEELLALGERYPIIHQKSLLVALGSALDKPNGYRLVPYLEFHGAVCSMYLHSDTSPASTWDKSCFFPAVSK